MDFFLHHKVIIKLSFFLFALLFFFSFSFFNYLLDDIYTDNTRLQ